jgi:hypothetical protein
MFRRNLFHKILRTFSSDFRSTGIFLKPSYFLTITTDTQSVTSRGNRLQAYIKIGHTGFVLTFPNRLIGEAVLLTHSVDVFVQELYECNGTEKHTRHWIRAHCQTVQHFFVIPEHVALGGGVWMARVPSSWLFFLCSSNWSF